MKTHGTLAWEDTGIEGDTYYASEHGARWVLRTAPYVTIKVKRIFPRTNPSRSGLLYLDDTPEVARDLEWLTERYPLAAETDVLDKLTSRAEEHRSTERVVEEILSGHKAHLEFREPARPAREYQLTAADLALATGRLLLADVVGLGKTMSSLLVLREPKALPALVVTLTHLPLQWVNEIEMTLPWLKAHVVHQMKPYEPATHRSMRGETPDILVMPYSKLRTWGDFLAGRVNTVIFDEVQELRRSESAKWKAAAQISDQTTYRVGLTATPIYNYAGEIHNIAEVLFPGALGSREEFTREWGGANVRSTLNDNISVREPGALSSYLRSEGLMLRRTRKDVGRELPEEPQHIPYQIDTNQDLYERMSDDVADIADTVLNVELPQQERFLARGELDWKLRRATGIAKASFVADFVEALVESDEQVVLFGWHRDVYDIWRRKLDRYHPAFYTGSESPTQKNAARDDFLSGRSRVLVMSLRSGAGLDGLQQASHVAVFGELDWSPGIHTQCVGRLDRDGQENTPVLAYFLVSEAGSDPVIAEVLNLKRMQSEPFLDPEAALLQPMSNNEDRVLKLAEHVIANRKGKRT